MKIRFGLRLYELLIIFSLDDSSKNVADCVLHKQWFCGNSIGINVETLFEKMLLLPEKDYN